MISDLQRRAIYEAVLYDTAEQRDAVLEFWLSTDRDSISAGEQAELDREFEHLSRLSKYSASLAYSAIMTTDNRLNEIDFMMKKSGYMRADDDEEEEEDV